MQSVLRSSAEEAIAATADTSVAAQAPSASGLAGDDKNLYVRDLPLTFTKEEFHKMYAPFGELVSSTVLADSTTGVSRGIGFARYASHDAAVAGLKATDGMILPGAIKPIIVQFARDTSRKNAPPPPHQQQQQHHPQTIPTMIIDPMTGIPYLVPMPFFHPAHHLPVPVQQPPPQSNAAAAAAAASPFANIPAPLPVTASGITTMPAPPPGMGAPMLPPAPAAPVADPYAAYYAYAGYGAAAAAAPAPVAPPAQSSSPGPGYPPAPYNPYGQAAQQAYAPYAVPQQGYGYPPPPPPPPSAAAPMGRGGGSSVRYSPYGPPHHRGRSNGTE